MRHIRTLAMACALVALAALAAACGSSSPSGGSASAGKVKYRIGVVFPPPSNPYYAAMWTGAQQAAKQDPSITLVQGAGFAAQNASPTQVVNTIKDLLTKQVDALVIADGLPQYEPVLKQALSRHVPVVFTDADLTSLGSQVTTVATDNLAAGKTAGAFIAKTLGGHGKVGLLQGLPQLPPNAARTDGAKEVLAGTQVQVVAELPTQCDRAKAVAATKDMLTAHPDVQLIYAACGDPVLGAERVVVAEGKTGKVLLVGYDAQPEEIKNIEAGTEFASIAQFPGKMGRIAIEKAVEAKRTGTVPANVDTGVEIVTKANAASFTDK